MQKHTAHIPTTLGAIACAVLVLIGIWWMLARGASTAPVTDPVGVRDILEYSVDPKATSTDAVVTYAYKGAALPEKLTAEEVVERRTAFSYTKKLAPEGDMQYYETIIYSGESFVQDGNGWYERELATTTKAAFDAARRQNPIAALFVPRVEAAGDTVYSGAGDGDVGTSLGNSCPASLNWDAVYEGNFVSPNANSTTMTAWSVASDDGVFCGGGQQRAFLPFNTSSIPASTIIRSASLHVYVTVVFNEDNDGTDYMTVVQTTQTTHTTLSSSDFLQCGSSPNPTEGVATSNRKDLTSVSTNAYLSFDLNTTGVGWIKKQGQPSVCSATAGITCLGVREGHDTTNNIPTISAVISRSGIVFSSSESSGTTQDPYLSVVYAEPNVILKGGRYQGVRIF